MLLKIRDFICLTIFFTVGVYAQIFMYDTRTLGAPSQLLTILSIGLLLYAFFSYLFCEYSPDFISRESDIPLYLCLIIAIALYYITLFSLAFLFIESDNPIMHFIWDYFAFIYIVAIYAASVGMLSLKKGIVLESRFAKEER